MVCHLHVLLLAVVQWPLEAQVRSERSEHPACLLHPAANASVSSRIVDFLSANNHSSLPSVERLFQEEKVLVTTKVCVAVQRSGLQWRRYRLKVQRNGRVRSTCIANGQSTFGYHGVWVEEMRQLVPCAVPQRVVLLQHPYCYKLDHRADPDPDPMPTAGTPPPSAAAAAPANTSQGRVTTRWFRGLTLLMAEKHSTNLNHFNRDIVAMLHVHSVLRVPIERMVALDTMRGPTQIRGWPLEHLRAQLPHALLQTLIGLAADSKPKHQQPPTGVPPVSIYDLAREALAADTRTGSGGSRAPAARAKAPPVQLCFEAVAQKFSRYSADQRAFDVLRERAYAYCHVSPHRETQYILFEVRTHEPYWRGTVNGSRAVSNLAEVRGALERVAARFAKDSKKLAVRFATFGDLDYCGQVHLAAGARVMIGVHGQALSNSIFLRRNAALIELFHRSFRLGQDTGHLPIALAANMHYAAGHVDSCTEFGKWKFDSSCMSFVNTTDLEHVLLPRVLRAIERYSVTTNSTTTRSGGGGADF